MDTAHLSPGVSDDQWAVSVPRTVDNGLDEDMFVNCRALMAVEPKALEVKVGFVHLNIIDKINDTAAEMYSRKAANEQNNRFKRREVIKFDYDIALSFSGADRHWASRIADALHSHDIRVFYDEYEKADLWGKDLVQHLDEVYRLRARYCIPIVSANYASGIWTNHELKSALARSITQNEEYLLPVRLDNTTLPGLRPTVAYQVIETEEDVELITMMTLRKLNRRNLINYAEFSAKWVQNIVDINRSWNLDCLAFCIDQRYLLSEKGDEYRVGISYGVNTTSPRFGLLQPSEQEGENVFGLHAIAVTGENRLNLWDEWLNSLPAVTCDRLEHAVKAAFEALASIDDAQYSLLASCDVTAEGLYVSSRYLLDEFDIS
ncbi:TIR domain-containing protein [Streptomyces sp. YIM S03343]